MHGNLAEKRAEGKQLAHGFPRTSRIDLDLFSGAKSRNRRRTLLTERGGCEAMSLR